VEVTQRKKALKYLKLTVAGSEINIEHPFRSKGHLL
jgi:hypothetical protein